MSHKTVRPNKLERTITAFCYVPVSDAEISPDPLVLFIHNISDAQTRRVKGLPPLTKMTPKGPIPAGKPAGWGMPGGGMKAEDSNNPATAAETELKGETGLESRKAVPFLRDAENKCIELDHNEVVIDEPIYFEKGQRPSIEIDARHHAIENPIYVFRVEVVWEGCKLQKLLRREARRLISVGEKTAEDIARDGVWVWFSDLAGDKIASLGIDEIDEVDGIGVFPLPMLLEERPAGFYRSHIRRTRKGLEEQGKLDQIMGVTK